MSKLGICQLWRAICITVAQTPAKSPLVVSLFVIFCRAATLCDGIPPAALSAVSKQVAGWVPQLGENIVVANKALGLKDIWAIPSLNPVILT